MACSHCVLTYSSGPVPLRPRRGASTLAVTATVIVLPVARPVEADPRRPVAATTLLVKMTVAIVTGTTIGIRVVTVATARAALIIGMFTYPSTTP